MEIPATEFKTRCLKLMDRVSKTRESIVITKRGRPVAKLSPIDDAPQRPLFGCMAGTVTTTGDILAPVEEAWSALAGDEDNLYGNLITNSPGKKNQGS